LSAADRGSRGTAGTAPAAAFGARSVDGRGTDPSAGRFRKGSGSRRPFRRQLLCRCVRLGDTDTPEPSYRGGEEPDGARASQPRHGIRQPRGIRRARLFRQHDGVLHCVEVICRSGRRWSDHGRRGRREVVEWRGDAWGSRHVTVLWSQDPCSVAAALSATRSFPEVWMRTRGRVRRIGTRNTCARIRGRSIRSELSEAGWCPTWSAWHCASIPLTHAHLPVVRRAGLLRVAALEVPVVAGA